MHLQTRRGAVDLAAALSLRTATICAGGRAGRGREGGTEGDGVLLCYFEIYICTVVVGFRGGMRFLGLVAYVSVMYLCCVCSMSLKVMVRVRVVEWMQVEVWGVGERNGMFGLV